MLTPVPAILTTPGNPIPPTVHHLRVLPLDDSNLTLPGWIDGIGALPLIYVGLGAGFSGYRGPEIFGKLLAGLADVDAEIVLTVGNNLDPASFGPQPAHIHLERYLPLGRCWRAARWWCSTMAPARSRMPSHAGCRW